MMKLLVLLMFMVSCGGGGGDTASPGPTPTTTKNVLISWTANRETKVNTTNGGYKICTGSSSTFTVTLSTCTDVPYVSGSAAPTSKTIQLTSGTWYVKVVAYSGYGTSSASTAQTVVVP